MRFMILVKATEDSEAGVMPGEELVAEMAGFRGLDLPGQEVPR